MWQLKISENLRNVVFPPYKANHGIWMCDRGYHWEYVAVMVDYILVFSQYPYMMIETPKVVHQYKFKLVGIPEYYCGSEM